MDRTRRGYLAAAAGVGLGATAGCLGGGSGGANGCTIEDEPTVSELAAPTLGPSDADVTVLAFEDFACPHCATYSLEVFPQLRSEYVESGVVRYGFHDFPIPVDEQWSWQAASAARGVQDEIDDETFFDYSHALFENQSDLSAGLITDLANDVEAPGCAIQADAVNETDALTLVAPPETDIVSYMPTTDEPTLSAVHDASQSLFNTAMNNPDDPIFTSVYRLSADALTSLHPSLTADRDEAAVLRSVLMKPEHETHAASLVDRLADTARSLAPPPGSVRDRDGAA